MPTTVRQVAGVTTLCVDRWSGPESPSALEIERKLRAEGLVPYRYSDPPGKTYAPHRHATHEVRWLLSGRMRVRVAGFAEEILLGPGDRLDVPAGLTHAVAVEGDEPVVCVAAEAR